MRKCLLLLSLTLWSVAVFAQAPANDECITAIDLGLAPTCPDETVYTNIDATASVLPFDNTPICFNTVPDRDVWFTFQVPSDGSIVDFTLQLASFTDNGIGILNPQIAVYRIDGSCDELAEFDCLAAEDGDAVLNFDLTGLTPGETYYLRINDFSASATPNAGEFTLCVGEFVPFFNLCESTSTTSCFGTLYDSGGPDGDYQANENCTFTICPNDFNECIGIDLVAYNIENNFDQLIFFAGEDTSGPVISTVDGSGNGNPFQIETNSDCITVQLTSDGSAQFEGFELTWQCSPIECNSSLDDITVINNLPFEEDNLTTCDNSATYQSTACGNLPFMAGPESVFTYTADGTDNACYRIQITGAAAGTGVLVLDGPPTDPASTCVATGANGVIGAVSFDQADTYYIVVANADGCTEFDIEITETTCVLDPSLEAALCNPLNGCQNEDGVPAIFNFSTDFFVDIDIVNGVNDGCWGGIGAGNFYWFTIESAADGPFGFTFQAADPAEASDIDFNVWGPYTNEQVCGAPEEVIELISTTQPLASSWAGGTEPTGLADISPLTGVEQTGLYDCDEAAPSGNDDFVDAIETTVGEVYVVLVNDWGGDILSGVVQVDFSASGPGVLDPIQQTVPIDVDAAEVCQGTPVQLMVDTESDNITWEPAESLSCSDCPNPIATPTETTEYTITIDGVCVDAIGNATVNVYNASAGEDQTVCLGEEVQIVAGQVYLQADYTWTGPAGTLSCTDCPEPIITASTAGVFTYSVTLNAPGCEITDEMTLTVFPNNAAEYEVSDDLDICEGESVSLGGPDFASTEYSWTSVPAGFMSDEANPTVSPTETTTYYLEAENVNSGCLFASIDSVTVVVSQPFDLAVEPNNAVCQGDTVVLSTFEPEEGVTYSWSPTDGLVGDASQPNISAAPEATTTYTLTAVRGACEEQLTVTVEVNEISIDITSPGEDVGICLGESVSITANAQPAGIEVVWTPTEGLDPITGTSVTASPTDPTLYIATVSVPGCVRMDSLFIDVDSLPVDMSIMPQDTTICPGSTLVLESPVYDPNNYPDLTHQWTPGVAVLSPDTLYNLVVAPEETTTYIRETINGACEQTDEVTVNVEETFEVTINPEDPVLCPGETLELTTSSSVAGLEFTWSAQGTELSCSDCPNPSVSYNVPGQYTISVSAETEVGCPATDQITVTVSEAPSEPVLGYVVCEPEVVVLNTSGNTNPDWTYQWATEDGSFTSTDINPTFDLQQSTTFTYSISNGACPPLEGTFTISIAENESVVIEGDAQICVGETTTLTAVTSSGSGDVDWFLNGDNVANNQFTFDADAAGLYSVIYTPNSQCPDVTFTSEITVEAFAYPLIDTISFYDPENNCIFEGQAIDLFVATDTPDAEITWTDESGAVVGTTASVDIIVPELFPDSDEDITGNITYTVNITGDGGCGTTGTVEICVQNSQVQIPNAFTPNGDDFNNTFSPIIGGNQEVTTFEIYNRWGQKVFDAIEQGEDAWDGTFNDSPAPADVYVYVIVLTNVDSGVSDEIRKGDITLVR